MGDRLSHCCCGGCDLFQTDFDLYYRVNTPPVTDDWTNETQPRTTAARRYQILPGNPGDGMIYVQDWTSLFFNAVPPPRPNSTQAYYPSFRSHPDPEPIRALPGFASTSYVYQIRDPDTGDTPGYYRLFPASRSGPLAGSALSVLENFREPPWQTYWRDHWELFDAEGPVDLPAEDQVPFRLLPGQWLESRRMMPAAWWSLDCFRLLYGTWFASGQAIGIELARDAVPIAITAIESTPLDPLPPLTGSPIQSTTLDQGTHLSLPRLATARGLAVDRFWVVYRDDHFEFVPQINVAVPTPSTPHPERDLVLGGWEWSQALWDRDRSLPVQQQQAVRTFAEIRPGRIQIRGYSGPDDGLKLGSIAAYRNRVPRLDTWPRQAPDDRPTARNLYPTCRDTRAQAVFYPYGHLDWQLQEFAVTGMDASALRQTTSVSSLTAYSHGEPDVPMLDASVEIPASRYDTNDPVVDNVTGRRPRNLAVNSGDMPIVLQPGFFIGAGPGQQTGRIEVRVTDEDAENVHVEITLRTGYRSSPGVTAAGPFDFVTEDLQVADAAGLGSVPGIVTGYTQTFESDPTLNTDPFQDPLLDYGWLALNGKTEEPIRMLFALQRTGLVLVWSVVVPRWERNDFPTITVRGDQIDWDAQPVGPLIHVIRSMQFASEPTDLTPAPFKANVRATGTAVEIDLSTLRITIG